SKINLYQLEEKLFRTLLFANQEFCRLLGYLPAEIPATSIANIHLPEDLATIIELFDKMAKGIVNTATDIRVVQKNGTIIWVDIYTFKAKHHNQNLVFPFSLILRKNTRRNNN
ncbi:MAG: PAS domain-containing protein, partial [Chitinophagaceae bacterium]